MTQSKLALIVGLALFAVVHVRASDDSPEPSSQNAATGKPQEGPLFASLPSAAPAPPDNPTTPEKVALGKQLFFDPRLSGDNSMSCATCHEPTKAFGDGLARAKGRAGNLLPRNTQTVLNVGLLSKLFWDGRAENLEEQALVPIQSADEMDQNLDELELELAQVPEYARQFKSVFGTGVGRDGIAKALAAYQRTLIAPSSPFDRFLQGDKSALSASAQRGLELFTGEADCVRCHRGPMLTDEKFYRLRVLPHDKGRGAVTGKRSDNDKFRTPSLRNVAQTGPYMHDGSLKTLAEVVTFYFRGVPTTVAGAPPLDVEPLFGLSFSDISSTYVERTSGTMS